MIARPPMPQLRAMTLLWAVLALVGLGLVWSAASAATTPEYVQLVGGTWVPADEARVRALFAEPQPAGEYALAANSALVGPEDRVVADPPERWGLAELRVEAVGPRFYARTHSGPRYEVLGVRLMYLALGGVPLVLGLLRIRELWRATRVERLWSAPIAALDEGLGWRVEITPKAACPAGHIDVRLLCEEVSVAAREIRYSVGETVATPATPAAGRLMLEGQFEPHLDAAAMAQLELTLEVTARVGGGLRRYRQRFTA